MAVTLSNQTSGCLIDEISDQFLVCGICSEGFKRPKTLRCLHTFCEECLEIRYAIEEQERPYRFLLSRSLSCPICHAKTELPPGGVRRLPNNAVLTQLDDIIRRRKLSAGAQSCDICSAVTSSSRRSTSLATAKCVECAKMMCTKCVEIHRKTKVTRSHCLFDIQVEKDVECKVHREEAIRFYCQQCQACICILCTFQDHAGHSIFTFSEAIDRFSVGLRSLLDQARSRSQRLGSQVTELSRCQTSIKAAEEAIRNTTIELIGGVRRRERELLAQLHSVYDGGPEVLVQERETMGDVMRSINATCDLADVLLEERSVEFLLIHQEISDKLNAVLQNPLKEFPEELLKRNISFTASSKNVVESVGFLHVSNSTGSDFTGNDSIRKDYIGNDLKDVDILQSNNLPLSTDESVESNECPDLELFKPKLECVCDRKPVQTSSSSSSSSSCCLDRPEALILRGRPTLRPPSPRGPDLWPPPPIKLRRRTTDHRVQLWDSGTETVALATDTRSTNTVAIATVDRSTLTTLRTTFDRTTDTDWLVMSRDQETFTSPPLLLSGSVQTDPPRVSSKSVQSQPETLNKLTMTRKAIQLERETNTPSVARFDCEVTARIIGDDKSTSTTTSTAMLTVDVGVGCDWDFDQIEDNERSSAGVLRRGNGRSWKRRSFDPDESFSSSSSSSTSSSSLFLPVERRTDPGSSSAAGMRSFGRHERSSTDDDDGYESRQKMMTTSDVVGERFERRREHSPSDDRELMDLEKYEHHQLGSSSSSLTGSSSLLWRDSSSSSSSSISSSAPSSSSSSSLLISSSSLRRISPSVPSSSIADDFSLSAETVQLIDQSSAESSAHRLNHSTFDLVSSGFTEELSTLDEELENLMEEEEIIPAEKDFGNRPPERKPEVESKTLPFVGERIDPIDHVLLGEGEGGARKEEVQANLGNVERSLSVDSEIDSSADLKNNAGQSLDKKGKDKDVGLQMVLAKQVTDGDNDSGDCNNSCEAQTESDDPSKMQDNAKRDIASKENTLGDNALEDNASRDSDVTQPSNRVKDDSTNVNSGSNAGKVESGEGQPPDITIDILPKDQIRSFSESPNIDSQSNEEDSDTTSTAPRRLDRTRSGKSSPKGPPDKSVPPLHAGLSPETLRRRSKQPEQTEPETEINATPTNISREERRSVKPDLISETPIHPSIRKKRNSDEALPGVKMESMWTQLERFLPELRAITTSLDSSSSSKSSSSSHSFLVHLLTNLCSALARKDNSDEIQDESNPLNTNPPASVVDTSDPPPSAKNPLHRRPTVHSVFIDRAVSPVRAFTRDSQTSTLTPALVTQGSNTEMEQRVDIGLQTKHVSTCDRDTSMQRTLHLEKETSTPRVHHLHKNTSTDNQIMVDNQTTMTSDVKAAYLEATSRPALTFTRGTQCRPPSSSSDRASSPVRFSCVDKAVLATKGEALEPMDTFPGVGKGAKGARKPFVSSSRKAKLECISEGTIDEETEDEDSSIDSAPPSTLSSFRLKMIQRLTTFSIQEKLTPKSFAAAKRNSNNNFSLPVSPRPRKAFEPTAFRFEVHESKKEEAFGEEEEKEEGEGEKMDELEEIVEIFS